jgi:hypothetical protein
VVGGRVRRHCGAAAAGSGGALRLGGGGKGTAETGKEEGNCRATESGTAGGYKSWGFCAGEGGTVGWAPVQASPLCAEEGTGRGIGDRRFLRSIFQIVQVSFF